MMATLITLVAAHFIADFWLQTDWMVANKTRLSVMIAHIAIVAASAAILLGWLALPLLAVLTVTHGIMDWLKVHWMARDLRSFLIDQGVHLATIGGLTIAFPDAASRGAWSLLPEPLFAGFHFVLLTLAAMIATTSMGAILVGHALQPLAATHPGTSSDEVAGLKDGGTYIGWLERALTLLFVAVDQPTGVGILLAAKSILRFGDIKDSKDRARAEYIMIGTFLSIGWALAIAILARKAALVLH